MMTNRLKPALLAAAIGFGGIAAAQAAPVVEWGYSVTGAWGATTFTTGTGVGGVDPNNADRLRWGQNNGAQSSLTIGNNPATGTVLTGDTSNPNAADIADALTLTHANQVLPSGGRTLTSAVLQATLALTPVNPPGSTMPLPSINYDIRFTETTNQVQGCPVASPPGNPCNDIFVMMTGALNQQFDYDGSTYYLNILPLDGGLLSVLPNAACAASGAPNGCIGFTTIENQDNTLQFGFTITTRPISIDVPAPGVLALLGLGLGALGLAGRRRKAA